MSTIESNFNGYPKVTDWDKVYFLLQQANSEGFNAATKKEIVQELFGDVSIQGADYEDLPVSTSSAVVPLPIPEAELKYGFLANGKYSQPNGPTLEYSEKQWGLVLFDNEKWVKKFTLEMPTRALDNGEVTTAKLADNSVSSSKLADSSVASSKLANNSVTSDKLADTSVSPIKTTFFEKYLGSNFFNTLDQNNVPGYYLSLTTGLPTSPNEQYNTTGFFPITNGDVIVIGNNGVARDMRFICIYGETGNFISGTQNVSSYTVNNANAKFARVSYVASYNLLQINKGSLKPYEAYVEKFIIKNDSLPALSDGSVTEPKIGTSAVTASKIGINAIINSKIASEAVTFEKTDFFDTSKNKLNPVDDSFIDGYYLNITTGAPSNENVGFDTSNFIPCQVGDIIYGGNNGSEAAGMLRYLCEYNDAGARLAGSYVMSRSQYTVTNVNTTCIRASFSNALFTKPQIQVNIPIDGYDEFGSPKLKKDLLPDTDSTAFQNDIAIASRIYTLEGIQVDLFADAIIKRVRPFQDDIRFSGTATYLRRFHNLASLKVNNNGKTVITQLINRDLFDVKKSKTSNIYTSYPNIGDVNVSIQFVGDSWTNSCAWFKDALISYVPNRTFIGLRRFTSGSNVLYDEGRGGWSLSQYFTVYTDSINMHFFMHPNDANSHYFGSTGFWKNVWAVINGTAGGGFEPAYSCGRYNTFATQFDQNTGFLISPAEGNIMYDTDNSQWKVYTDGAWVNTTKESYTWSFNYKKYLDMWEFTAPSMLFLMLGLNDFRSSTSPESIDFTTWNANMETFIASYIAAVPGGKFVICTSAVNCGTMDNDAGNYTARQNACMWMAKKNVIDKFDNRTSQNIYVIDTSLTIDGTNGYSLSTNTDLTRPFSGYTGTDSIKVQTNQPHPVPNYQSCGLQAAAFIQYYRNT